MNVLYSVIIVYGRTDPDKIGCSHSRRSSTEAASTLTNYIGGLAPAFIAGFGVHQAIEVVDSLATFVTHWDPSNPDDLRKKKALLTCVSVLIAAVLVALADGQIDVLRPFFNEKYQWELFGGLVTVIFISGGTEGFNSLMKWLSYKKEDAKATAAQGKGAGGTTADGLKIMPS